MRPSVLFLTLTVVCVCLVFSAHEVEGGKKKREFLAYLIMSLFRKPKKVVVPLPLPIPFPIKIHEKEHDVVKHVPYQESYGGYGGGGY